MACIKYNIIILNSLMSHFVIFFLFKRGYNYKITTFFLINLLQQGHVSAGTHRPSLQWDLFCHEMLVLIKYFKTFWSSCTATITKMFEHLSTISTHHPCKGQKCSYLNFWEAERSVWDHIASFVCSSHLAYLHSLKPKLAV